MHAKRDMNWISATSMPDSKFNTLQWKMGVPIWALGYISTLRTRNKNTGPDFWFNNPVYCWLFLFVIYSYFILPQFLMQITYRNSSHWNALFAVTIASVACHIDDQKLTAWREYLIVNNEGSNYAFSSIQRWIVYATSAITCSSLVDEPFWQLTTHKDYPDSKVHVANMRPTWVISAPDGTHVGHINLAIRICLYRRDESTFWTVA